MFHRWIENTLLVKDNNRKQAGKIKLIRTVILKIRKDEIKIERIDRKEFGSTLPVANVVGKYKIQWNRYVEENGNIKTAKE